MSLRFSEGGAWTGLENLPTAWPDGELPHLTNWIESTRSRTAPTAPAEIGVHAVYAAHLGNQAYRTGQVATRK